VYILLSAQPCKLAHLFMGFEPGESLFGLSLVAGAMAMVVVLWTIVVLVTKPWDCKGRMV
jgi:hypothetical protein